MSKTVVFYRGMRRGSVNAADVVYYLVDDIACPELVSGNAVVFDTCVETASGSVLFCHDIYWESMSEIAIEYDKTCQGSVKTAVNYCLGGWPIERASKTGNSATACRQ